MALIYHYTSIDTLALILKNRAIRFNRLDRVDDMSESKYYGSYDLAKFMFVSCWSDSPEESIPLWHMYTNKMSGVCITLDKDWMYYREWKPDPKYGFTQEGKILSPIPFEKFFNDNYFIIPNLLDRSNVLRRVKYVDNPSIYLKDVVDLKVSGNGEATLSLKNLNDYGTYKQNIWSFQNEVRFILFILPSIPIPPEGFSNKKYLDELPSFVLKSIIEGRGPKLEYFDMDIDPAAIDSIEVTLGPLCDSGDEIIVDSLLKLYTKSGILKKSNLTGSLRKSYK